MLNFSEHFDAKSMLNRSDTLSYAQIKTFIIFAGNNLLNYA